MSWVIPKKGIHIHEKYFECLFTSIWGSEKLQMCKNYGKMLSGLCARLLWFSNAVTLEPALSATSLWESAACDRKKQRDQKCCKMSPAALFVLSHVQNAIRFLHRRVFSQFIDVKRFPFHCLHQSSHRRFVFQSQPKWRKEMMGVYLKCMGTRVNKNEKVLQSAEELFWSAQRFLWTFRLEPREPRTIDWTIASFSAWHKGRCKTQERIIESPE